NEHFPFIDWRQMVFCGRKDVVRGDIMIDDHPKNLRSFPGEKIVFTQPHNAGLALPDCIRVSAWDEIVRML
ncbi:5' nucleotidase, NT5C type, partial [Rikenella microfusus]|nr:5'(3')-deoxyribonucleotidase [Rikenella microfusus]